MLRLCSWEGPDRTELIDIDSIGFCAPRASELRLSLRLKAHLPSVGNARGYMVKRLVKRFFDSFRLINGIGVKVVSASFFLSRISGNNTTQFGLACTFT